MIRSFSIDKDAFRLHTDSDVCKGNTDTPKEATHGTTAALKLDKWFCKNPF